MNFPSFSLAGMKAVMVGAGRGIGYTLALGLAQAGADVVGRQRGGTITELEDLAGKIREQWVDDASISRWMYKNWMASKSFKKQLKWNWDPSTSW